MPGRVLRVALGLLALMAVPGCRPGPAPVRAAAPAAGPNPFAASALWDDGRAEIDAYEAAVLRYGVPRAFTAYLIVVKEDFSKTKLVKADPGHDPDDLFTVLKLNHAINYQTGIYSYHQLASAFFDRASMDLVKFSLTSNEWCGNTYKEYTRRDGKGALHAHTYWDHQSEATYDVPVGPDVVFYDQLPLWIRSLPQTPGTARSLRLLPTQIESRGSRPDIVPATLQAVREERVVVPAGGLPPLPRGPTPRKRGPPVYSASPGGPPRFLAWGRPAR